MKKRFIYIKSDTGFYLPYVLFISVIALSFIMTSIIVYNNELNISHQLMEQLEAETLIQMGRAKWLEEAPYAEQQVGEVVYDFPNGHIKIKYEIMEPDTYQLYYYVLTNQQFDFQIIGTIYVK